MGSMREDCEEAKENREEGEQGRRRIGKKENAKG